MGSGWSRVGQALGGLLVLTLFLLCPASAFAHKLYVFAQVEGTTIQGRAYFPGDVPAQKSDVIARDPSGRELGRTTTDDDGKFTFTAREHVDHFCWRKRPTATAASISSMPPNCPTACPRTFRAPVMVRKLRRQQTDHGGLPAVSASKENEPPRSEPNWLNCAHRSANSAGRSTNPTSVCAFATY